MTGSTLAALALGLLAGAGSDPADVLKAGGVAPTPAGVEAYLRGWIVDDRLKARIAALIEQLGNEDFDVRENAGAELARIGPAAVEPLRSATSRRDPEIR